MRQVSSLTLVLFSFSLFIFGQDRASIEGTVTDTTGSSVAKADVELAVPSTGLRRHSLTTDAGIYRFPSLPVGSYQITITKPGFTPYVLNKIDLNYGQVRTADATLEVGMTRSAADVTATSEVLDRTNAEVSGVIESPQIREIPLDGRNWATLMTLAPEP